MYNQTKYYSSDRTETVKYIQETRVVNKQVIVTGSAVVAGGAHICLSHKRLRGSLFYSDEM